MLDDLALRIRRSVIALRDKLWRWRTLWSGAALVMFGVLFFTYLGLLLYPAMLFMRSPGGWGHGAVDTSIPLPGSEEYSLCIDFSFNGDLGRGLADVFLRLRCNDRDLACAGRYVKRIKLVFNRGEPSEQVVVFDLSRLRNCTDVNRSFHVVVAPRILESHSAYPYVRGFFEVYVEVENRTPTNSTARGKLIISCRSARINGVDIVKVCLVRIEPPPPRVRIWWMYLDWFAELAVIICGLLVLCAAILCPAVLLDKGLRKEVVGFDSEPLVYSLLITAAVAMSGSMVFHSYIDGVDLILAAVSLLLFASFTILASLRKSSIGKRFSDAILRTESISSFLWVSIIFALLSASALIPQLLFFYLIYDVFHVIAASMTINIAKSIICILMLCMAASALNILGMYSDIMFRQIKRYTHFRKCAALLVLLSPVIMLAVITSCLLLFNTICRGSLLFIISFISGLLK